MPTEGTQHEKLVDDVLRQTLSGQLNWKVTGADAFARDVLHGIHIFKSFVAGQYVRGEDVYTLGFIERKNVDDEYGVERSYPELLVNRDDKLILLVTEYDVDRDKLERLGRVIGDRNEDAKSLLGSF